MQKITLIGMGASAATLTAEGWDALRRAEREAGARRPPDAPAAEAPADPTPTVPPAANLRNPLLFMTSSLARLGTICGRRSRRYSRWSPGSDDWDWRDSARSPT